MLQASVDTAQFHRHVLTDDYRYVTTADGQREAEPINATTKYDFTALQRAVNRVRAALQLGKPLTVTGTVGNPTFQAVQEIADANVQLRPEGAHFAPEMLTPLNRMSVLAPFRAADLDGAQAAFKDLIERARYYTSIFNLIADTVWWSTTADLPPCPVLEPEVPPKWPIIAAGAVGLAAGAATVLLILLPRSR